MAEFKILITTPHVLTEVSNLEDLRSREKEVFRSWFVHMIEESREHYDESRLVLREPCFGRLGLTDAAIAALAGHGLLFLTDDFDLYSALVNQGEDAINFNHLRSQYWQF